MKNSAFAARLTAFGCCLVALFGLWQGLRFVDFQWRAATYGAVIARAAAQPAGADAADARAMLPSIRARLLADADAMAYGTQARKLIVNAALATPSASPALVLLAATSVLEREPTAALYWTLVADKSFELGAPAARVLELVRMSRLVAPRETEAMVRRIYVTFRVWSQATAADKRAAAVELSPMPPFLPAATLAQFKLVIDPMPAAVKADIRRALDAQPGMTPQWQASMGL